MTPIADITDRILQRCRDMGFALASVCDATPTDYERELLAWIEQGAHGEMAYLARNIDLRLNPATFVPGAKSIICVADRYGGIASRYFNDPTPESSEALGRIARYARGKDYHRIMRDRLAKLSRQLSREFPDDRFRACVDTAPVLEREYAQRAGLGAIGKNTMLLERSVGSWLLLGEIITSLPLAASRASEPDPCGACTRCIEACPTQAIAPEGWKVDANRCISYLTIEHASPIDERFHEAMGDWIFGCDVCQEVCPHNQPKSRNADAPTHPAYAPRRDGFDLLELLNWTEGDRAQELVNSAIKRARLDMLKRNAVIAAGNALSRRATDSSLNESPGAALRGAIRTLAHDEGASPIVRDAAWCVLRRLES